ncbi:hypothetical protein JJB07_18230 [Tumebacillus sp. ITR2]|uniref:Uncharacterized protein n=1 Tax=Tumebacillus amylolyticus TaxID=2801339 RepID=A0ABS1JEB4_9BACL|nr:hypothetical protein [Tumebacillus amylolyticus]MBL0388545.1 hypothetical protein [Tumebacillus amylolyticus]
MNRNNNNPVSVILFVFSIMAFLILVLAGGPIPYFGRTAVLVMLGAPLIGLILAFRGEKGPTRWIALFGNLIALAAFSLLQFMTTFLPDQF